MSSRINTAFVVFFFFKEEKFLNFLGRENVSNWPKKHLYVSEHKNVQNDINNSNLVESDNEPLNLS